MSGFGEPEDLTRRCSSNPTVAARVVSATSTLESRCLQDIARYLLTVSAFELTLDDLVCLANARNEEVCQRSPRYPTMLSQKLRLLPGIFEIFRIPSFHSITSSSLQAAVDLRNLLSHGALISLQGTSGGWRAELAKMGRPVSQGPMQALVRSRVWITHDEIHARGEEIRNARMILSQVGRLVFVSGQGWPLYMVGPEGDPLRLFPKEGRDAK